MNNTIQVDHTRVGKTKMSVDEAVDGTVDGDVKVKNPRIRSGTAWQFFYDIPDVANLDPAEEQSEPWVALINEERVGMAVVDTFGTPFINRVAVKQDARRQGVATALLRVIEGRYGRVQCRVRKDNKASLALLKSVEWERTNQGRFGELWWYDSDPEAESATSP